MGDINVSNVSSTATTYSNSAVKTDSSSKKEDVTNKEESAGAVFEKSAESKKATYTINKMSAEDRASLVAQLKADQENRMSQLTSLVSKMMTGQANTFAKTDDSMWKFLASGNFEVDPETKAQAQKDIAEDGYWGVKQTSQRLFDFAAALAGDDVEKMKEMQKALQKGYEQATKTWGKELPDICKQTLEASNKLFDDYYASVGA